MAHPSPNPLQAVSFKPLPSLQELQQQINQHDAVLVWFFAPDCSVCHSLKPKAATALAERFPKIELFEIDCQATPEVRGQLQIFSVPTLILYFQGTESIRKSRNFSVGELLDQIDRPYQLLFQ